MITTRTINNQPWALEITPGQGEKFFNGAILNAALDEASDKDAVKKLLERAVRVLYWQVEWHCPNTGNVYFADVTPRAIPFSPHLPYSPTGNYVIYPTGEVHLGFKKWGSLSELVADQRAVRAAAAAPVAPATV